MRAASPSPGAQFDADSGVQRFVYGENVRQTWPRWHSAFAAEHVHRPLTSAGWLEHAVVTATDSQPCPAAQAVPQPPQFDAFDEMSTQVPLQQRFAAAAPQLVPSPFFGCWQAPDASQVSLVHGLPSSAQAAPEWIVSVQLDVPLQVRVTQASPVHVTGVPAHAPAAHRSPYVHAFWSSQAAVLAVNTHCPFVQRSSVQTLPSLHWRS